VPCLLFLQGKILREPLTTKKHTQSIGATPGVGTSKSKARWRMPLCVMWVNSMHVTLRTCWKILLFRSFQTFQITYWSLPATRALGLLVGTDEHTNAPSNLISFFCGQSWWIHKQAKPLLPPLHNIRHILSSSTGLLTKITHLTCVYVIQNCSHK
jgi:hypothetical protein